MMERVARQFLELGADCIEKPHCLFMHIGHRFVRIEMQ